MSSGLKRKIAEKIPIVSPTLDAIKEENKNVTVGDETKNETKNETTVEVKAGKSILESITGNVVSAYGDVKDSITNNALACEIAAGFVVAVAIAAWLMSSKSKSFRKKFRGMRKKGQFAVPSTNFQYGTEDILR